MCHTNQCNPVTPFLWRADHILREFPVNDMVCQGVLFSCVAYNPSKYGMGLGWSSQANEIVADSEGCVDACLILCFAR